ncbi:uncharacterized protein G2W53_009808 [Senna tora]|uniref:Uncharacterized protein n=1 Tax=Senna tora TaxID=362788 RepID=A0A834WZ06_9FABA|nr:uncharacterized protein G2W53_009808 [Senna tora]
MLRLESSWHERSVDHVLTYPGRQIAVGSQKSSRITRQKTRCATESNTSVPVVFANGSGFDAPIGVVLAWEGRGSCINIFQTINRVVLMLRLESFWHGRTVDRVLTYPGRQIAVRSEKPSRITRQKTRCASESSTSVRIVFANRSGFDALIGVVLAWEERGSCLNISRTTNRGKRLVAQLSQTRRFALYSRTRVVLMLRLESSWHGRGVNRVLTYPGRQIAVGSQKPSRITRHKTRCATESNKSVRVVFVNRSVGSQKPSRITRQKTRCATELNTSVRVVFANPSGFDAPIGVVLAWEERGSCLNISRTKNRGRISETFTNYDVKDSLRN